MSYYRNKDDIKDISIDVPALEVEYENLGKALTAFFHHFNLPFEGMEKLQATCYIEQCSETIDNKSRIIPDSIKHLKKKNPYHHSGREIREYILEHLKKDVPTHVIEQFIGTYSTRRAAIRLLVDTYAIMNPDDVNASYAADQMNNMWRTVVTNIGYDNKVKVIPGVKGTMTYSEKTRSNYQGGTCYNFDIGLHVDHTWVANVQANGIQKVDIAGKNCITLDADEILEHELLGDDVRLFTARVAYSKVPQTACTWKGLTQNQGRSIVMIEDRVIAIQTLTDSKIITTGKDKSWAIRTMKMRMKKKMLGMMDLL